MTDRLSGKKGEGIPAFNIQVAMLRTDGIKTGH